MSEELWQSCKEQLMEELNPAEFRQWIEPLNVEFSPENREFTIHTRNRIQLEKIKKDYLERIKNTIATESDRNIGFYLVVRNNTRRATPSSSSPQTTPPLKRKPSAAVTRSSTATGYRSGSGEKNHHASDPRTELNPVYTFENFVEGGANRVAHSAALYVASEPGQQYNPLYIHGSVGLGKTHLLHAIGNKFLSNTPEKNIICINTVHFVRDISKAARHKTFPQLQKFYQQADLLLIDDVQNFSSKEKSQEEFFDLFNFLLSKNSRIVLSSDTYPKQLESIPERLRSRFSSGITVEVEPPQLEMRVNILHSKARLQNVHLNDDVAFFIAENITTNVRELEGALNNVVAYANFIGKSVNMDIARESLKNSIALQNRQISIEHIQKTTADYYQIRLSDIYDRSRKANIVKARHVAMYLSKKLTSNSLQEIGQAFGGRDHTTVIHAERKIKKLIKTNNLIKRELNILEQTLNI